MRLNDFQRWYVKVEERKHVLVNVEKRPEYSAPTKIYRAPLGDLLEEYVNHLKTPRWRRGWDWQIVRTVIRDTLNHWGNCIMPLEMLDIPFARKPEGKQRKED